MTDGYRKLYDHIHRAIITSALEPREIFAAAGLVLANIYFDMLRDAPQERLKAHMLRQTCRYVLDQIDEWEERERRREQTPTLYATPGEKNERH
jgi:hypothetical protein